MTLDADRCYRALASRDRRFEGRFVVGVRTTGVYCKPGCPARLPKRENVDFYSSPDEAERAGFRPCRRCKPNIAAGAAASLGSSATVLRALRLIDQGALDGEDLERFAARLGLGARQLTRLFARHVGTPPHAVARARRVHVARKLIEDSALPMTAIAHAAGFSSVRRFNAAVRDAFRGAPRDLRRRGRAAGPGDALTLSLPFTPPYDAARVLGFLGARAIPGVERVDAAGYRRTARLAAGPAVIEVNLAPGGAGVELRVTPAIAVELFAVAARVSRLFDLRADPRTIRSWLGRDRFLAGAVRARPGLRVPGAWDPFELCVRAILGQMVSVQAATTLSGRLVQAFGEPLRGAPSAPGLTHLFPQAASLAGAPLETLGLPRARASAIRGLASAVASGALAFDEPADARGGLEEVVARLTAIPGIGEWTAQYVAMRAFGEPDAFPASDLGLRRACAVRGEMPSARELAQRAEAWRPWRAYAAMYLWTEDT
jgi:AraC family transcriptional regulator, regulatory protein of adaptative response / DNA-3-methyladenine glycosylase II